MVYFGFPTYKMEFQPKDNKKRIRTKEMYGKMKKWEWRKKKWDVILIYEWKIKLLSAITKTEKNEKLKKTF